MNGAPWFEVITQQAQLKPHGPRVQAAPVLGIDTDTTGLDPLRDTVRLVQIAAPGLPILIFDMWNADPPTSAYLQTLLAGRAVKVFQNAKFDMKFLQQAGLPVAGRVFDTYLAAQLLRQKTRLMKLGLDTLAQHYLSRDVSKDYQTSDWRGTLSREQYEYAARDAAILLPLREAMIRDLQSEDLVDVAQLEFHS